MKRKKKKSTISNLGRLKNLLNQKKKKIMHLKRPVNKTEKREHGSKETEANRRPK